jgi:GNAT superfamily N-acetyltransferase
MRPRRDADTGLTLNLVTQPHDPRLVALAGLLARTFADPNSVLGLDRLQEFLSSDPHTFGREFRVLVAEDHPNRVIGGSVFSYIPASNCGFSEYLVLERATRGQGLGRELFDGRGAILDELANRYGKVRCRGVFIEVDSPERTPRELLDAERASSMDARERLSVFAHLGFRKVDVPYVQPPLDPGKESVDYLDLLFAPSPWSLPMGVMPVEWILQTLEPIWTAWTPLAPEYLEQLRERIGSTRLVSLVDAAE